MVNQSFQIVFTFFIAKKQVLIFFIFLSQMVDYFLKDAYNSAST